MEAKERKNVSPSHLVTIMNKEELSQEGFKKGSVGVIPKHKMEH